LACKFRQRKDDIPKRPREKTWACEECGALAISVRKPTCRKVMQAQIEARLASAQAESEERDNKERK
jgi:hypothetical protein